jgi:hypothetical protein
VTVAPALPSPSKTPTRTPDPTPPAEDNGDKTSQVAWGVGLVGVTGLGLAAIGGIGIIRRRRQYQGTHAASDDTQLIEKYNVDDYSPRSSDGFGDGMDSTRVDMIPVTDDDDTKPIPVIRDIDAGDK